MNKSMLVGAVLGAVGVTAGGAVATYSLVDRGPDYAEVVAVQPVKKPSRRRARSADVAVTASVRSGPAPDRRYRHRCGGRRLAGQPDRRRYRQKIATVAGAVGGGCAGNKVQEGMQERDTYTTTETRCSTVHDSSEKVVGYDVKYMLDGKAGQIRMERDPGSQIPVDKNGRLILSQGETLR